MAKSSLYGLWDFATEAELRQGVEKELGHAVDDIRWEFAKPELDLPYGRLLFADTLRRLGYSIKWPTKRREKAKIEKIKHRHGSAAYVRWLNQSGFIQSLRRLAKEAREEAGLNKAVRLEDLRDTLLCLGAVDNPDEALIDIVYPYEVTEIESVSVWKVARVYYMPAATKGASPIRRIYYAIDTFAEALQCHPAIALAFVLCDIPIFYESFVVIREDLRIEIIVNYLETSPQEIRKVYSLLRNSMLRELGKAKGKWARPRRSSLRTLQLRDFIEKNPNLTPQEKLEKWNKEHPDWRYKNVNSMAVVYSRLSK